MKILNFGSCNIDYVYNLDHIVRPGETETSSSMAVFPGGKGLNQSIALARAGAAVYHGGCVGEDGGFLKQLLFSDGVDVSCVDTVEGKNGHAIIQLSREGENSIFLYPGSNHCVTKERIDRILSRFSAGDVLLVQNEISELPYLVEAAWQKGMEIYLNPSPMNATIGMLDLQKISCLILNEVEAADISGASEVEDILTWFAERHPNLQLMLTLGGRGCVYSCGAVRLHHPIFPVQVVDTTAAGDTFTGYFIAGIAAGLPMEQVLQRASCAAAIAVSRKGAAPSVPDAAEVEQTLRKWV